LYYLTNTTISEVNLGAVVARIAEIIAKKRWQRHDNGSEYVYEK